MGRSIQATLLLSALLCAEYPAFAQNSEAPSNSHPLFPSNCVVVLLVGVPGDLESETRYRQELLGWLDVLERSATPLKILVLSDIENLNFRQNSKVELRKSGRTEFLALAERIKETNALTVIVWGHGGTQGNTSVFHVRGPRLTPADFEQLAARSGSPSQWILMFRGSGAFASRVAQAHREVLSSERDSILSHDPIGMSALLKIARENPRISLDKLAALSGAAIKRWYEERNLARTEEPTFWSGNNKPRLLAETAEESPEPIQAEATKASQSLQTQNTNDLPHSWENIHRVELERYPDSDGVTLKRKLTYTLGETPAVATEHEEFIQILTPEGKRFGDFDISYSPPMEEIEFLDCEVLSPSGKFLRLDPEAIQESRSESVGDYQMERQKFFSLPGVEPGAVIHVRYRTEWKKFPLPHISMEIPIKLELPAEESTIEVSVPKEVPFHFALENVPAADPALERSTYGSKYSWHFKALPASPQEALAAPRQEPRLLISTFPDWKAFVGWYSRICKLADQSSPELAAKAAELTRAARTDREKVLALYNYVASLRYVAVPLGVNSFRPHSAVNVLQNQFGDCKDKANLFNTLLRSLNIGASLVLVPRFSQAHESIPGFAFNHAISRVDLSDGPLWIDTTDDLCRFGLLPPGDPGRKVLVIDPQTQALTALPHADPGEHQLKLNAELNWSGSEPFSIRMRAMSSGFVDYTLRNAARKARDAGGSLPLLASGFRSSAGSFILEKQGSTLVSALDTNFSWQADGAFVGICSRSTNRWELQSPFWIPREWDVALHRRKLPLYLNEGYPLSLDQELQFSLPADARVLALPEPVENKAEPLRWRVEWTMMPDKKLLARLRAELARGELSDKETALFQKQLRDLLSALANSVSLRSD